MNNILQIYYSLLFYLLFSRAMIFINEIPWVSVKQAPNSHEIWRFLKLFNLPIWILSLIFLSGLFFCFLCIFKPRVYLKIITSVFALIIFLILYSYRDIGHHNHIWMVSSVLMCFFSSKLPLRSKNNYFTLRLTQALLLSHYFTSGLWKIRTLVSEKFTLSFKELLLEVMAYAHSVRGLEFHVFEKIVLFQYPTLLSFGYFFALLFQVTALLPVFFNRLIIPYGILAIVFHFLVGFTAGIYFAHTVLAVLFFLIIAETMMKDLPLPSPVPIKQN